MSPRTSPRMSPCTSPRVSPAGPRPTSYGVQVTSRRTHRLGRRSFLALPGLLLGGVGVTASRAEPAQARLAPLRNRVRLGAYVHLAGRPHADPVAAADLAVIEQGIGRTFDVVHYFFGWGRPFEQALSVNVPARDLMLSWKPDGDELRSLLRGEQDDYVDAFAAAARAYGEPVFLRFAWEMNGSWMGYSSAGGGPDADDYVRAWRHLVARFRLAHAGNVQFIWCPNESDVPAHDGNRLEDYWPGSAWVDVLGFDAYNWTSQQPLRGDGRWRSFEDLVDGPYQRLAALDTALPIWLCEWGTPEAVVPPDPRGASKADWFDAAGDLTRFRRLDALIYFSENDQRDTQRDWRLDSSRLSLRAFGQSLRRPTAG